MNPLESQESGKDTLIIRQDIAGNCKALEDTAALQGIAGALEDIATRLRCSRGNPLECVGNTLESQDNIKDILTLWQDLARNFKALQGTAALQGIAGALHDIAMNLRGSHGNPLG